MLVNLGVKDVHKMMTMMCLPFKSYYWKRKGLVAEGVMFSLRYSPVVVDSQLGGISIIEGIMWPCRLIARGSGGNLSLSTVTARILSTRL